MEIDQVIHPDTGMLGAIPIRRLLPAADRQMIGPFIFMDQGGPTSVPYEPGAGVPEHPHAGLATFTYSMRGSLRHRDSAGYTQRIAAGDIALMFAGSGITHEELADPHDPAPTRDVYFVQMWLALPDEFEDMSPALEYFREADLPLIEQSGTRIRLLLGAVNGQHAPTTCLTETLFANIEMDAAASLTIEDSVTERALMLLEGNAKIADRELEQYALHLLSPGAEPLLSSDSGCRAILLGGETFPSPRVIAGSFVASSEEKLLHSMRAYQSGNFPRITRESALGPIRA